MIVCLLQAFWDYSACLLENLIVKELKEYYLLDAYIFLLISGARACGKITTELECKIYVQADQHKIKLKLLQ